MKNNDIPVAVLQHYALPIARDDGHYRVVVGLNDSHAVMLDPWNRDNQPHRLVVTIDDFVQLWNYSEPLSPRPAPFFGTAAWPFVGSWSSSSTNQTIGFQVTFHNWMPNATPLASGMVQFSLGLKGANSHNNSAKWSDPQIVFTDGSSHAFNGYFQPGSKRLFEVGWKATLAYVGPQMYIVTARFYGFVEGTLPNSPLNASAFYPGYDYLDAIGFESTLEIFI